VGPKWAPDTKTDWPIDCWSLCDFDFRSATRSAVVVKALYYKPEGRGLETRRGKCFFSIYLIVPAAVDPGVLYSASNRKSTREQRNNVPGE
jgi:hypothetical protein